MARHFTSFHADMDEWFIDFIQNHFDPSDPLVEPLLSIECSSKLYTLISIIIVLYRTCDLFLHLFSSYHRQTQSILSDEKQMRLFSALFETKSFYVDEIHQGPFFEQISFFLGSLCYMFCCIRNDWGSFVSLYLQLFVQMYFRN